jgi:hypothetical protein
VVIDHYTNIRPLLANALNLRTVGLADHRPVASLIMSDVVRLHAIGDEFKSTLVPHPLPAVNRSFIKAAWADISACFQRCTETNRTGGRLSSGYSPAPCAPGEPAAAMTRLVHSARLIGHVLASPPSSALVRTWISRSLVVNSSVEPDFLISTLARIGSVWRRSTMPETACNALRNFSYRRWSRGVPFPHVGKELSA